MKTNRHLIFTDAKMKAFRGMCKILWCAFLGLLIVFLIPQKAEAQTLEAQKTHELSKDARKGEIIGFEYDEVGKQYTLTFRREKRKKKIYETYNFDYDFNLVENETWEEKEANKKKRSIEDEPEDADPWPNPRVIRQGINPGQITLRLGTLKRKWVCDTRIAGNYEYTYCYYKYDFEEEKVVKPQYDPEFEFPEGTPNFAVKLVTNLASKVAPLGYMTDEPATAITTGNRSKLSVLAQMSAGFRNYKFSEASGDIVVAGMQQFPFEDEWIAKIMLLKYSAEDLSLLKKNVIDLDYANNCFFNKVLGDGTMVLLFMPQKMQKGEPDPNPLNFMYMRVNSEAEVVAQTKFQSPSRQWNVADALLADDGSVYFYGIAETKHNDKYKIETRLTKGDNVQAVKFNHGNADYITSLNVDKFKDILKKPGNQKKADAYDGKGMFMDVGMSLVAPSGDFIFSGQSEDHDALYYFHLSPEGEFNAHYVINAEEKLKERNIDQTIFMNSDGKTATVFVGELEDIKNERALQYPRLATIDIAAAEISDIKTYGYDRKGKYYLDDVYSTTFIDDERITFFCRDAKDKEIWFGRVKLGQ